ncbi:MAG: disulfide bond formation protein B [Alphaproteobacteria bacterium]|nr:disulfide bond formation protein B [Alphaproteobacteria bacterium]
MTNEPCCICEKLLTMPGAALAVMLAGLGSLAVAYTAEYVFKILPCDLCLWQRVPYALAFLLGGLALVARPYGKKSRVLLGLCALGFLFGAATSAFHSGVERHWWPGLNGCVLESLGATSVEDLRNKLLATPAVPCDQIQWSLFGLTMANWNIPASLVLAMFAGMAALRRPESDGDACCCCCRKTEKTEA